jgi:hypothetical protein
LTVDPSSILSLKVPARWVEAATAPDPAGDDEELADVGQEQDFVSPIVRIFLARHASLI